MIVTDSSVGDGPKAPHAPNGGLTPKGRRWRIEIRPGRVLELPQELLLLGFFVVLVAFFALTQPVFATGQNLQNVAQQTSVLAMMAVGQLFVIVIGGLDLSTGFQVSMLSLVAVRLSEHFDVPVAFAMTVVAGAGIGLVNGFVVSFLRVSPIIATLATQNILFGATLLWTQGLPFRNGSPEYAALGQGHVWFLAAPTFLAIIVAAVAWVILNRTRFGRYVYAVGGNAEAARLSGISLAVTRVGAYAMCSVFTGIAAVTLSSQIGAGEVQIGPTLLLESIAAVFIGGAAMVGGAGTVLGVVLGAVVLRTLENGFNLMGVSTDVQTIVTGVLMIIAVAAYGFRRLSSRETRDAT